jgi:hypothetical protein
VHQQWNEKKPSYFAAKEVDEATIRERAVNFYFKEKEEALAKKLEQQRKYKEELDR